MENKVVLSGMVCDSNDDTYLLERPLFFGSVEEALAYAKKQLNADYGEGTEYNLFEIAERTEIDGVRFVTAYYEGGIAEYRIDEIN